MKKVYRIENLDCANCAAKMENAICTLDEVKSATVSFMTQKLNIEFADGCSESDTIKKIIKLCSKIEPDCTIKP